MAVLLWILGIFLALLLLLCCTRVGIHLVMGGELLLDAKVGWFHIHILPRKKADKKREEPRKESKKSGKNTEKKTKKPFPKPSFSDIRDAVSTLWPPLKRALQHIGKGLRIDPLDLSLTLGGSEDPSSAAQLYGEIHACLWAVMPVLEKLMDIPEPHIHIDVDFNASGTVLEGEAGVTARIGTLLAAGFTIWIPALKWFLRYQKDHKQQSPAEEPASA